MKNARFNHLKNDTSTLCMFRAIFLALKLHVLWWQCQNHHLRASTFAVDVNGGDNAGAEKQEHAANEMLHGWRRASDGITIDPVTMDSANTCETGSCTVAVRTSFLACIRTRSLLEFKFMIYVCSITIMNGFFCIYEQLEHMSAQLHSSLFVANGLAIRTERTM